MPAIYVKRIFNDIGMKPLILAMLFVFSGLSSGEVFAQEPAVPQTYLVKKMRKAPEIDARWDKKEWRKIPAVTLTHYMGTIPAFQPKVEAKLAYDPENLYLIFKVEDRHVRIVQTTFNGPVSTDACVEFFFSPEAEWPLRYFNLEINAGGTSLMAYQRDGKRTNVSESDFDVVEVAHTLPRKLENEISEPVTWYIEVRMPLSLLSKYAAITKPAKGVTWKGNFYKTSSRSSNPHYITWSRVEYPRPQFHLPQFFGNLIFR